MNIIVKARSVAAALTFAAALAAAGAAHAETTVVVGYQQIVGPFVSAIAAGAFDKPEKEAGYKIDWRQFASAGDISTALASGNVAVGVIGSTPTSMASTSDASKRSRRRNSRIASSGGCVAAHEG